MKITINLTHQDLVAVGRHLAMQAAFKQVGFAKDSKIDAILAKLFEAAKTQRGAGGRSAIVKSESLSEE